MAELDSIQQLRNDIEAEYREALHALDVLSRYLSGESRSVVPVTKAVHSVPSNGSSASTSDRSNRELVIECIETTFASVQAIRSQTGLDARQVRGVLYAPSLKARFETRLENGVTEYRWKGGETKVATPSTSVPTLVDDYRTARIMDISASYLFTHGNSPVHYGLIATVASRAGYEGKSDDFEQVKRAFFQILRRHDHVFKAKGNGRFELTENAQSLLLEQSSSNTDQS